MIRQWLRNFMIGRYGVDQLSIALMIGSVILGIFSSFKHWYFLSILSSALMFYVIFRTYSRNINRRWQENAYFMNVWQRAKKSVSLQKQRFHDRASYRYFTCPKCKTELIRKT